jgi:hypothetical protein
VTQVDVENMLEMPSSMDKDVVKALSLGGAHKSLGERVGFWSPDGRADDSDPLILKHVVERTRELGIPVVKEKTYPLSRSSIVRFLAFWVTQAESGWAVAPGNVDPPGG